MTRPTCTCSIRRPRDCAAHKHLYLSDYTDSAAWDRAWHDSPEGRADALEQARWDRQEARRNG